MLMIRFNIAYHYRL